MIVGKGAASNEGRGIGGDIICRVDGTAMSCLVVEKGASGDERPTGVMAVNETEDTAIRRGGAIIVKCAASDDEGERVGIIIKEKSTTAARSGVMTESAVGYLQSGGRGIDGTTTKWVG